MNNFLFPFLRGQKLLAKYRSPCNELSLAAASLCSEVRFPGLGSRVTRPAGLCRLFWNRLFETCLCVQCSFCGQAFSTSFLCLAADGLERHETHRPGVRSTWEGGQARPPLLLHHSATLTGQPPPTESVRPGSLQGPQGPGGLRGPRGLCSQPARGLCTRPA